MVIAAGMGGEKLMTAFIDLPNGIQTVFTIMLFIGFAGELCLLIYKLGHRSYGRKIAASVVFLLTLAALLILLAQGDPETVIHSPALYIPWAFLAAAVIITAVHTVSEFLREHRRAENILTPAAIREAINDLPMGFCFFDPESRIVLCNDKMRSLSFELMGAFPQSLDEFRQAVHSPAGTAVRLSDNCYRMADGSIYSFRFTPLTVSGEVGWHQLTAQDITAPYLLKEQLDTENQKLHITNLELRRMYAAMTEDIREKENLEVKMYVHDTMGRSLLTIHDIMNSSSQTEKKLDALQSAVSFLSEIRPSMSNTIDEAVQTADKLGVKVNISGNIPAGAPYENLMTAAIRECVTNCLRHAGGNALFVEISCEKSNIIVNITNNGKAPGGEVTEGSGLSSLRHSVEASGGVMTVSSSPQFRLELRLTGKEQP